MQVLLIIKEIPMPTEENCASSPLRECIAKAHERANTTLPAELKVAALETS